MKARHSGRRAAVIGSILLLAGIAVTVWGLNDFVTYSDKVDPSAFDAMVSNPFTIMSAILVAAAGGMLLIWASVVCRLERRRKRLISDHEKGRVVP
jgi:hypothetical protein